MYGLSASENAQHPLKDGQLLKKRAGVLKMPFVQLFYLESNKCEANHSFHRPFGVAQENLGRGEAKSYLHIWV